MNQGTAAHSDDPHRGGSPFLEQQVRERTRALEQAQAMLLRTERMNSLALLGDGLAHDLNNLLSAIKARAELVLMDLDEGKLPDRKDLVRVQEATQLAANLSNRLLALGRQHAEPPTALDLGEQLQAISPLLRVLLPETQTLHVDCQPGSLPFLGTRSLLEQILVNLVGNARDAMAPGGRITLRARGPQPTEDSLGPSLEVEDTGHGIPAEVQAQVFQPFFTTKTTGPGTGLGLASVQALLKKAGGSISFVSEPGRGTTFRVWLPRLP
jgi:signal transduction histidine kinase